MCIRDRLNAARAAGNKRTQLLLEALCSTGTRVSELQFKMCIRDRSLTTA